MGRPSHGKGQTMQIIEDIFKALADEKPHILQDLMFASKHTWKAVKKHLNLVLYIQAQQRVIKNGNEYRLEKRPDEAIEQ